MALHAHTTTTAPRLTSCCPTTRAVLVHPFSTHDFVPQQQQQEETTRRPLSHPLFQRHSAAALLQHKTTYELLRAGISLSLCRLPWVVRNAQVLYDSSNSLLGPRATEFLLQHTLYGHFCAGQDEERIRPTLERLKQIDIGTMLDYAAEQAVSDDDDDDYGDVQAIEQVCDEHTQSFVKSIQAASFLGVKSGSVAVCVTALINPQVLQAFSALLEQWQQVFLQHPGSNDGNLRVADTKRILRDLFHGDEPRQDDMMQRLVEASCNPTESGSIDLVAWMSAVKPRDFLTAHLPETNLPSHKELALLEAGFARVNVLAQQAVVHNTSLFLNAEQVRYQSAIDYLTNELRSGYNSKTKSSRPVVHGTLQCYRKDSTDRLQMDLQRSKRFQYHFGTKLVRGAYMESERELAFLNGYESPIHDTIQDTHDCYNKNTEILIRHAAKHEGTEIFLATHNHESIVQAVDCMEKRGIDPAGAKVAFGQLYGMSDPLTVSLAKDGLRPFKYVPYGEVDVLMPYLIRRATENSSMASGVGQDLGVIAGELRRRMIGF